MPHLLPIHNLTTGQTGCIRRVTGNANTVHRLAELGMRPGAQLEIVQHGSPCIIRLGNCKYCFRDGNSLDVLVQVE